MPIVKGTMFNRKYAMNYNEVNDTNGVIGSPTWLDSLLSLFQNKSDFLLSLRAYPFDIKEMVTRLSGREPQLETITVNGQPMMLITTGQKGEGYDITIDCDYDAVYNIRGLQLKRDDFDFSWYPPFVKTTLYIPYAGFFEIDPALVMGKEILIRYIFDFDTGNATVGVFAIEELNGQELLEQIMQTECVIGVDIPIGRTNADAVNKNIFNTALNTAAGIATVGASYAAGVAGSSLVRGGAAQQAMKDIAGYKAAGGAASTAIGFLSGIVGSLGASYNHGQAGGAWGSGFLYPDPFFIVKKANIVRPEGYDKLVGRPCGKVVQLSELEGFTIVGNIHLENIPATKTELDEIQDLLSQGVIL